MAFQKIKRVLLAANIIFVTLSYAASAEAVRTDLSRIELLADHREISAGQTFNIAIELEPNEDWHVYWENPGDAGLKLTMNWNVPEGFTVGELQFPRPHLIPFEEIVTYGYEAKVTFFAEVTAPDTLSGDSVNLSGSAFWLTCSDVLCVPQEANIGLDIGVGNAVIDNQASLLVNAVKENMPLAADWKSDFHTDGENFTVVTDIPKEYEVIESAYLFPHSQGMMENVYNQDLSFVDGKIIGKFKTAYRYDDKGKFDFVLNIITAEGQDVAFTLVAQKSIVPLVENSGSVLATDKESAPSLQIGLIMALTFAFLGGLILNLMPCVFPILSLKAMSVVDLAKKDPVEVKMSGLLYTAGVVICFGLIGAIVNLLSVGWGFHMQMPIVNFVLGLLMIGIALNLFGIFEFGGHMIGLGQGLMNDKTSGRRTSFLTGFLAVVVATPCTAPFMASALGFAFIEGGVFGMLVFISLGFGLAFPYLILCYIPAFRNFLPRPGAWMETMRNVLAFPMLATALWLFWILGNQLGLDAMAIALFAGLMFAFFIWGFSKESKLWKLLSIICLVGSIYSGVYLSNQNIQDNGSLVDKGGLRSVEYSSIELQKLIDRNQAVFVYFTADWCVTCKLNERVALSQPSVYEALKNNDITVMKADWTNQNPDITGTLQRYGRIGVPLYLYFPAGRGIDNPDILPQLLTADIIIEAL